MTVFGPSARFPAGLRVTLRQGRWLLAAAETGVSALLLAAGQSVSVWWILVALAFYNALSIALLRRPELPHFLVPAMIVLDLVFVFLSARLTGGVLSPFLGLSYLIILAAALWYDLLGGIAAGVAASFVAVASHSPALPFTTLQISLLGNLIPSFLLAGGFTGFLVRRLKGYYERDVATRLREQSEHRELQLAHEMQEALLPTKPPEIPGLQCAFLTRFAGEVGGDFLLFLSPEPEAEPRYLLGIVMGDVAGKGIPAALASTGIAHLLPWLHPMRDPARALQNLNVDLNERLPDESYATLILAEVGPGNVRLWTAGHPPALLWRASEGRVRSGEALADPPLGLFPHWAGQGEAIAWSVGDVLLLYTDGASETRNGEGVQFTADRLAAALSDCADRPATEIVQCLFQAVEAWGTPVDDLTLAVCKKVEAQ